MRLPRWLVIVMITMSIIMLTKSIWGDKEVQEVATIYDIPKTLDNEALTLNIYPESYKDSVAVFTSYKGGNDNDYLYLIPDNEALETPDFIMSLADSVLSDGLEVKGYFYKGTGIPEMYLHVVPRVGRYRVFRYHSIDIKNKTALHQAVSNE